MELRDEIALRVLPDVINICIENLNRGEKFTWVKPAETAYGIADAMLKVREETPND